MNDNRCSSNYVYVAHLEAKGLKVGLCIIGHKRCLTKIKPDFRCLFIALCQMKNIISVGDVSRQKVYRWIEGCIRGWVD